MGLVSRIQKELHSHLRLIAAILLLFPTGAAFAQDSAPRRVEHTPWLAVRIIQDGKPVRLEQISNEETRAKLKRKPFTLIFPTPPAGIGEDELVYQIAASKDSIALFEHAYIAFRNAREPDAPQPPYFQPGTGMADTEAGSGTLRLNEEAHNYLIGLRLGPDRYNPRYYVRYISDANCEDCADYPVSKQREPLYLVIFHDKNKDEKMELGEFELLELRF